MSKPHRTLVAAALAAFFLMPFALAAEQYRIDGVTYDIKGSTREYPLTQAVPIDTKRVFQSRESLDAYVADLSVRLNSQRVFETASIDLLVGDTSSGDVIPVNLVVHTVDTWNIIALPYPKYDSNSGFELKLKFKDYNFFGSMQVLNGDVNYKVGNDGKSAVTSSMDFTIPFTVMGYSSNWKASASVEFPQDLQPLWKLKTGFNIAFPVGWTAVVVGLDQSLVINDRDSDDVYYSKDGYYFKNSLYANVPFTLYRFDYFGNLTLTPEASVDFNWAFDGIQNEPLRGPELSWGYSLGIDRVDWIMNYRTGLDASLGTTWSYNLDHGDRVDTTFDAALSGYTSFFDRLGLTGRLKGYYNLFDSLSESAGDEMRGILNSRVSSDTAITLNVDLPLRVMRVNFQEMTGVAWTRYIGFEMHASPFFDATLSHDTASGRYYALRDGWYSGGMEIIVYPAKMRSIYGRVSVGFDLEHAVKTGSISGVSDRDGEPIRELFFGIGLHY